jgi:putative transposase
MPGKNSIKTYVDGGYYHIFNRGVEKRLIFQDTSDYGVFLSYLKDYLMPKDERSLIGKLSSPLLSSKERDKIIKIIRLNNFSQDITLLAYCLMPNHFHLFIMQKSSPTIDKFMKSLCTRYAIYFNRKYKRVGPLFQGSYKAVLTTNESQYLHLSRYIHKHAILLQKNPSQTEQPSSYPEYIGVRNTEWVHPEEILAFFSKTVSSMSYANFVNEYNPIDKVGDITLES